MDGALIEAKGGRHRHVQRLGRAGGERNVRDLVARIDQVRRLRVLIAHGTGVPADRDHRVFYAAGADVRRITYPTGRLCPEMLKDVNLWVIGQVNAEHDVLVQAAR